MSSPEDFQKINCKAGVDWMAVASGGRKKLLQGLVQSLQQCVEAEAWGLRVEAAEEGQK